MAKVKKIVYGRGGEYDLIDYQSLSNEALLDKDPLTLEQAKELLYLYNEDAEIYRDEIEECSEVDELADLVYENNLGTIENTYNFSWWGGVRQYIIVHNNGSNFDFDDPTMIFMSRQTGGGDVRGGYEKYEAFDYNDGYMFEDFAITRDRLTYIITTDDGKQATFDTEDDEGYSLYVVEDETGTFEADDTTDVDEVAKAFEIDSYDMYAKGGRLKSFLGKAYKKGKEVGGKAYAKGKEKARELAHKTKEKAKETIHNAKRSTTTQVLRETKGADYDTTYEERNTLDEASDIVNDNYKYTPIPYKPKKEMGGGIKGFEDGGSLDVAFQDLDWRDTSEAYYELDFTPFMNVIEEHYDLDSMDLDVAFQDLGWRDTSEAYYELDFTPFMNVIEEIVEKGNSTYAKGGEITDDEQKAVDSLYKGYADALLFSELDSDTDEPLDYNYYREDIDDETTKRTKEKLLNYYRENKDAIKESDLDLDTIGNNIWYTRGGHGAGFFDHNLDSDIEEKLTKGANKMGEYPSVETYDGKIFVSEGRVFDDYAKGGSVDEELIRESAKNIYERSGNDIMQLRRIFLQLANTDEMYGDLESAKLRRKIVSEYQSKEPNIMAKGGNISFDISDLTRG